jgi:thiamine-phosphate pyrophosphorylase
VKSLPRLHVTTDDDILARDDFVDQATALLEAHGPAIALHLRGPGTATRALFERAGVLVPVARAQGALLLVNDRADVALAVDADGVQLGQRSLTPADARRLRRDWVVGVSVHSPEEAAAALAMGSADFLLVGTVWESRSHPGRPGAGPDLVRDVRGRSDAPAIAIGGVTPERVAAARRAGAWGVAVLSGVWDGDASAAAAEYLAKLGEEMA